MITLKESFTDKLARLAAVDGVLFCIGQADRQTNRHEDRNVDGDISHARWSRMLSALIDAHRICEDQSLNREDHIRVATADHAILVKTVGEATIAVVVPSGHKVTKSIHRYINRIFKGV